MAQRHINRSEANSHQVGDGSIQKLERKEPISITELKPAKIIITDILLNQLQKEAKRTGLGAIDILRHAPKPLPDGLNHQKVQRWISGDTRTAIKPHWDLVLLLYAKVLD